MKRELTPLQEAKRLGLPYVSITVDNRHLQGVGGKVTLEGPVTEAQMYAASRLIKDILTTDPRGEEVSHEEEQGR